MSSIRTLLQLAAGALILAIAPWPFDEYYTLLRFFICATCAFAAYVSLHEKHPLLAVSFLTAGVFFNPIMKVQIARELWIVADILVATLFLSVARLAPRLEAAAPSGRPIDSQASPEPQTVELSS